MGNLLNSQYSQFQIWFDKTIFPDGIQMKYDRLLARTPDIFDNIGDLVNYSIMGYTFPGIDMSTVTQSASESSTERIFKNGWDSVQNSDGRKEITIEFRLLNGFLNYSALRDLLIWYWEVGVKRPVYLEGDLNVMVMDEHGFGTWGMRFESLVLKSISDLTFAYANNTQEFKTFSITLAYNSWSLLDDEGNPIGE